MTVNMVLMAWIADAPKTDCLYFDVSTNELLYEGPVYGLANSPYGANHWRSARIGYDYDKKSPYLIVKGDSLNG